jgi:hypothetical protein
MPIARAPKVIGLLAFEDAVDVARRAAVLVDSIGPIDHESQGALDVEM